jgi:hypothetical protein
MKQTGDDQFTCCDCNNQEYYAGNRWNVYESEDEVRSKSIVDNDKRSFIYRINKDQFYQDNGAI